MNHVGAEGDAAIEIARKNPKMDVGVHLNLVVERTGRSAGFCRREQVPSLVRADGTFRTNWVTAVPGMKTAEVEKELDAQIQKALDAGIDVTHIDCHRGFIYHGDFADVQDCAENWQ